MKSKPNIFVVMAVVALIGLITALVLPAIARTRNTASQPPCRSNLRMIQAAKIEAGKAQGWSEGTLCDTQVNRAIINHYLRKNQTPRCPDGGSYIYHPLGEDPECSIERLHSIRDGGR